MRTKPSGRKSKQAFNRLELLCCIGGVMLLAGMTIPSLGNTRSRSERAVCVDNLRRIGQALQLWGAEHEQRTPWQTLVTEGGSRDTRKVGVVYREFLFLSNYLVTPRILACPSDALKTKRAAVDWSNSAEGGYANGPAYGNNVTSYTLNLHGSLAEPSRFLSGDRNLEVDNPGPVSCSLGMNNVSGISTSPTSRVAWTNGNHGISGNVLVSDGRVIPSGNSTLKGFLQPRMDENGMHHFLFP